MSEIKLDHGCSLREKLLEGVDTLSKYVSTTLGPKGRNVLIHKKGHSPFVTKDGVTVAQSISFKDPFINAGAEVVKQVSAKTNSDAGDGTTTSTVLAGSIFRNAVQHVNSGVSPIEIKRGLEKCLKEALEIVSDMSKPISSAEDINHIASISANNDLVIGDLVATAVDKVGKNGSVTIEEARSLDTTLDLVEGFRMPSGYSAGAFVTDERRSTVRYDDPLFMITDSKIEMVQDILPALEIAAREGRPFIIVADEIEGQALAALIMNAARGTMKVASVKAPSYGEERISILSDLAVSTGSKFFRQSNGDKITNVSLKDFGSAKSIEISKRSTIVVDGSGTDEEITATIEKIKESIKNEPDLYEAERLQSRLTRLASGVAIIRVGAATEVEMIEKKHRVEDALEAVRSAQVGGIVAGGGLALFRASCELDVEFSNKEQEVALTIFKAALLEPLRVMSENAGMSPDVAIMRLREVATDNFGINFTNGEVVEMFKEGIIDPAKVTCCALKNAVSAAATLLLTNHSIVED